jgi:hypothetical protein
MSSSYPRRGEIRYANTDGKNIVTELLPSSKQSHRLNFFRFEAHKYRFRFQFDAEFVEDGALDPIL